MRCPHCNSTAIINEENLGTIVCAKCGVVLEENAMVNNVEFAENAGGGRCVSIFILPRNSMPWSGDCCSSFLTLFFQYLLIKMYSGVIGKFVSATAMRPYSSGLGRASVKASREITMNKGKQQIMQLAAPLRITNLCDAVRECETQTCH